MEIAAVVKIVFVSIFFEVLGERLRIGERFDSRSGYNLRDSFTIRSLARARLNLSSGWLFLYTRF